MHCPKIDDCAFFDHYKNKFGEKELERLVNSYCKGPLQPLCRRLVYMSVRGEVPTIDLFPDGYRASRENEVGFLGFKTRHRYKAKVD